MAQEHEKQNTPTDVIAELPVEDVRTAIAHVIEVAAAFEGHGIPSLLDDTVTLARIGWPEGERTKAQARDRKFLEEIVEIALAHRVEQRRRQRDALLARLVLGLTPYLKAYADATRAKERELERRHRRPVGNDELSEATAPLRASTQQEVCADLLKLYIVPDASELDLLVPELPDLKAIGTPAEVAEERVAKFAGLGQRWVHDIKMKPHVLDDARYAFGRWVSQAICERYAQHVLDKTIQKTEAVHFRCTDLEGPSEGLGLMMDRRAEDVVRVLASELELVAAFHCRAVVDAVRQGAQLSADTPAEEKALVTACVNACQRGDLDAARRTVRELEAAILPSMVQLAEHLRSEVERTVGPLATLPPLPNGKTPDMKATLRVFFDSWPFEEAGNDPQRG